MRIRKSLQEHRINDREDGGVRADAKGKGEDSDGGEARILAQHAGCEAQVLPASFEERFPACGTNFFLRGIETAALETHGAKGFLTAHSLLHSFFGGHLEEAVQFFVEFLLNPFLSEQGSEFVCYA